MRASLHTRCLTTPAGSDRYSQGAAAWVAFFLRSGGDRFEYSRMMFPLVPALYMLALAGREPIRALAITRVKRSGTVEPAS